MASNRTAGATRATPPQLAIRQGPWRGLMLALAAATLGTSALAGRPLQTEDAGVMARGECELEGVAGRDDGSPVTRELSLGGGCGVGHDTQLGLELARTRAGAPADSGLRLGGKTMLWQAPGSGDDRTAFTLAYGWSAARAAGASWGSAGVDVAAVLSIPAEPLTWHFNLGLERDTGASQTTTVWGVAAELAPWGAFTPMAEVVGNDRGEAMWNLGLAWEVVPERLTLDVSWGRQFEGGTAKVLTTGFKLSF